jgi:hypothetical protein
MILIVVTALIGGASAFAALLPYGIVASILGAPLGGSAAAALTGILIAMMRAMSERKQSGLSWMHPTHSSLLTRRM